jgi:hypothetical protein
VVTGTFEAIFNIRNYIQSSYRGMITERGLLNRIAAAGNIDTKSFNKGTIDGIIPFSKS